MPNDKELNFPFVNRKMLDFESGATFSLLVNTVSAAAIATQLTINGITKDGTFKYLCDLDPVGGKQQFKFRLTDIPIFLSVIQSSTSSGQNNIWIEVKLQVNDDITLTLTQGYPNATESLSWPSQQPIDKISNIGFLQALQVATPAAGEEWTRTIPANEWCEIISVSCKLVTSATVANRRPTIKFSYGGSQFLQIPTPASITASQTSKIFCFRGAIGTDDQVGLIQTLPLPNDLILGPGGIIGSETTNLQANDEYQNIYILLRRFLI